MPRFERRITHNGSVHHYRCKYAEPASTISRPLACGRNFVMTTARWQRIKSLLEVRPAWHHRSGTPFCSRNARTTQP